MAAVLRPYFPELGELRSALVEIQYRALCVEQCLRERRPLNAGRRREMIEELAALREAASEQNAAVQWAEVSEQLDRMLERTHKLEAALGIESRPDLTLVPTGEEASD